MTEAEWLACADPQKMLDILKNGASERKLRLFACGCVGHLCDICYADRGRCPVVRLGERFADNRISVRKFRAARERFGAMGGVSSMWAVNCGEWAILKEDAREAAIGAVRDAASWFFPMYADEQRYRETGVLPDRWPNHNSDADREPGFQHLTAVLRDIFGNPFRTATLDPSWLSLTVTGLAEVIYAERAFGRLSQLADALERAGCTNADILAHCRGPGPHVRGCWVVDLVLGKA